MNALRTPSRPEREKTPRRPSRGHQRHERQPITGGAPWAEPALSVAGRGIRMPCHDVLPWRRSLPPRYATTPPLHLEPGRNPAAGSRLAPWGLSPGRSKPATTLGLAPGCVWLRPTFVFDAAGGYNSRAAFFVLRRAARGGVKGPLRPSRVPQASAAVEGPQRPPRVPCGHQASPGLSGPWRCPRASAALEVLLQHRQALGLIAFGGAECVR
jgi:hypothetical protein